ncbi:protein-disulfide reductase DsbD domain-containing protein [Bartonella sp. CB189]|uniref:protein-disulfide reductase DsbD domain-containing protein n=1 Tax=Bartonella sp. CB189 TaxID=3112254 RepID=UPI002F9681E3
MKKTQIFINSQRISNFFYKKISAPLSITFVFLGLLNFSMSSQANPKSYLVATPWYESDGGRIRLAITNPSFSEVRDGIIEVVLKPEWKTYWRNPGSSGMAPFFEFNQQISYEIFYPVPQLYETENDWTLGYKNKVVLPFTLFDSRKNLSGSLTIGLCNKICIPFSVNFDFSPPALQNKHLPISLLKNAQASLPHTTNYEFQISAKKDANMLFIKIKNNKAIPTSLFLDGGEMQIGPAKKINENVEYTLFNAPIYFIPDEKKKIIFYTVTFKDNAFNGTFVLHQ